MARKKESRPKPSKNGHDPTLRIASAPPGENDGGLTWRLASEVESKPVQWLVHPWIPRGMLSIVVGHPNVGKSTFLAAIIGWVTTGVYPGKGSAGKPGRVVLLPGAEEDFDVMTLPRLVRANCDTQRVKVLEGGNVSLVRDRDRLCGIVSRFEASLLVGDPIDSYVDDGFSEDRGQDVRPLLEAAAFIGKQTGAAVVFARHPGKDPNNVMPGSRQWRAVPRVIVQLTTDGHNPPRFMISHFKDSLGTDAPPRRYVLLDDGSGPRKFQLEEEVDRSAEELAKATGGPTGRFKLLAACGLVRWMFSQEEKPTRSSLADEARRQELGGDTVNEALRLLGVRSIPPAERGSPWYLVRTKEEWPAWLPEITPPQTSPNMS